MAKERTSDTNGNLDTGEQTGSGQEDGKEEEESNGITVVGPVSNDARDNVPIDRGWAWVILAAAWLNVLLTTGLYKVSGIVFVELQKRFDSSSSVTSLISSLLNVSYSLTSMVVNTIILSYVSVRQSVILGALLLFLTFIVSAFTDHIEMIIFMQGVVLGIAQGFILPPTYSLVGHYFSKRRGVANCFMLTGSSSGSLMFSFVIRKFVNDYGLSGTFMLIGGLMLHVAVAGALMRPIETYNRRPTGKTPEQEPLNSEEDKHTDRQIKIQMQLRLKRFDDNLTQSDTRLSKAKHDSPQIMRAVSIKATRKRTVSEAAKPSVFGSISSITLAPSLGRFANNEFSVSTSIIDLSAVSAVRDVDNFSKQISQDDDQQSESCAKVVKVFSKFRRIIDCRVMRRGLFLFFLPQACMLCSGPSLIQTFIPPLARDIGLPEESSDFLISLISIVDIFSVITWGIIADRDLVRKTNIIALTVLVMAGVTFFVPYYRSYEAMVFFSVMYGFCGRLYFPFFPVVLVEVFGLDNLRSALGLTILFHSSFTGISTPIAGLLRDVSGSYNNSFHLMATYLVVGGVGIACLPLVETCVKKWCQRGGGKGDTTSA